MKPRPPTTYEKFVLDNQREIVCHPAESLSNSLPQNLFVTAFRNKIQKSVGDKLEFYSSFASAFYRLHIFELTAILEEEFDLPLDSFAREVYFREASSGKPITEDKSDRFAIFEILHHAIYFAAEILRIQLVENDDIAISRVIEMFKRALRLRCTDGITSD